MSPMHVPPDPGDDDARTPKEPPRQANQREDDDVFVPDPVLIEGILREHPGLTGEELDAMLEAAGY